MPGDNENNDAEKLLDFIKSSKEILSDLDSILSKNASFRKESDLINIFLNFSNKVKIEPKFDDIFKSFDEVIKSPEIYHHLKLAGLAGPDLTMKMNIFDHFKEKWEEISKKTPESQKKINQLISAKRLLKVMSIILGSIRSAVPAPFSLKIEALKEITEILEVVCGSSHQCQCPCCLS